MVRALGKPKNCLPERFYMVQRESKKDVPYVLTASVPGYSRYIALAFESALEAGVMAKVAAVSYPGYSVREFAIGDAFDLLTRLRERIEGIQFIAVADRGHITCCLSVLESMLP